MADIEKVIKALEHCTSDGSTCDRCDYWEHNRVEDDPHCGDVLMCDALELLKSQQAEIERMKGEGKPPTWKKGKAFCGNCGGCLENKEMFSSYHVSSIRFCKWCGVPVDWSNEAIHGKTEGEKMNKLVTDNPQNNVEIMLNLAFSKDQEAWIRGGSEQGEDCTLIDFINRACSEHKCEMAEHLKEYGRDFGNIFDMMMDCSMGGCPLATFYFVAVQASELRSALRLYEEGKYKAGEQEPRVMTLDEVKAFDWDYCYLEEERLTGKEYRAVCGDYALICITWPCIASMRIQHGDDSYGKKWRCWSAKPTDEQRQAVKWE